MSDLTRYRIESGPVDTDLVALVEHEDGDYLLGRLVPDDTLQQIAEAWHKMTPGERERLRMVHPRFVGVVTDAVGVGER